MPNRQTPTEELVEEHRTDHIFDAFFGRGGERFAIYSNNLDRTKATHFKITVTDDVSASIELDREELERTLLIITDAIQR